MSTAPRFIHIAAGALRNAQGEVLICQRPQHKIYPGEWEFPGGKVEPGEDAREALRRELREELGIEVTQARPLIRLRHVYPELGVDLDTWLVTSWTGTPTSNEHPAAAWVAARDMPRWKLLAADAPIVKALCLPSRLAFTPDDFEPGLACASGPDSMMRLRLPGTDDARYRALARALAEAGERVLLDRDPADVARIGAAGFHATSARLRELRQRPVPADRCFGASCHSAADLERARQLDADYTVLGPVKVTRSHPQATPMGWDGFAQLATGAGLPVYAIGGVGPGDLDTAWHHGAQGVAGISAFWGPTGATADP